MRGHLNEAAGIVGRVLALPHGEPNGRDRLAALDGAGGVAYWQGQMEVARDRYLEALAIAERLGDESQIAEQSYNVSFTYQVDTSDLPRALELLEKALASYRRLGDRAGIAKALWGVAYVSYQLDERERAHGTLAECIALMRELNDRFGLAWALHAEALIHLKEGDPASATEPIRESLRIFDEAQDLSGVTLLLLDTALQAQALGDPDRAVRLLAAGVRLRDESGAMLASVIEQWQLPGVEALHAAAAESPDAREAGRSMSRADAVALALA